MDGDIHRHGDGARPVAPGAGAMHRAAIVLQVITIMCNRFLHLLVVKHTLLQGRRNILQNISDASDIFWRVGYGWKSHRVVPG